MDNWKPIKDISEKYEVSNSGKIREKQWDGSYKEKKTYVSGGKPGVWLDGHGYQISRIVLHAFKGLQLRDSSWVATHVDGDLLNCQLHNLVPTSRKSKQIIERRKTATCILCVEDNKIFSSIASTANYYGYSYAVLREIISNNQTFFGKHFVTMLVSDLPQGACVYDITSEKVISIMDQVTSIEQLQYWVEQNCRIEV